MIDVHVKSALAAAVDYYRSFVIKFSKEMGEDNVLPISGAAWPASTEQPVCPPLADLSVATVLRSRFVAISGRGDAPSDYMSIREFCDTVRKNLFVDPHMVPAFELKPRLNSYVLDFWRLHNYRTILRSNKISENHAWGFLKHFALQVKGVFKSLDRRRSPPPRSPNLLSRNTFSLLCALGASFSCVLLLRPNAGKPPFGLSAALICGGGPSAASTRRTSAGSTARGATSRRSFRTPRSAVPLSFANVCGLRGCGVGVAVLRWAVRCQVHVAFDQLTKDFGEKFMLIAKEQDHS